MFVCLHTDYWTEFKCDHYDYINARSAVVLGLCWPSEMHYKNVWKAEFDDMLFTLDDDDGFSHSRRLRPG